MAELSQTRQTEKAKATQALAERLTADLTEREAQQLVRDLASDLKSEFVRVYVDVQRTGTGKPSRTMIRTNAPQLTPAEAREIALTKRVSAKKQAIDGRAFSPSPRAQALLRGREQLETLLSQSGGTFDQEQVQTMLYGISRQAIDKRVREGSLLAVPGPNGARRYPVCQFMANGSLVKGLKEVQAALPLRGPWSAFLFLMQPHAELGGDKPLDLLRRGKLAEVGEAAKRLGVQGS